ncbi:hypothetical protein HYC85_012412 [Camellia sinensis]|uniref:Uncharacterized protein n=1 Tax=Camellia sinensis TaxID=4442 RepID=A0A7J7HCG4_CAMSI|nr:hypothetical protein HYC85_012412 [Camellia sinensis]
MVSVFILQSSGETIARIISTCLFKHIKTSCMYFEAPQFLFFLFYFPPNYFLFLSFVFVLYSCKLSMDNNHEGNKCSGILSVEGFNQNGSSLFFLLFRVVSHSNYLKMLGVLSTANMDGIMILTSRFVVKEGTTLCLEKKSTLFFGKELFEEEKQCPRKVLLSNSMAQALTSRSLRMGNGKKRHFLLFDDIVLVKKRNVETANNLRRHRLIDFLSCSRHPLAAKVAILYDKAIWYMEIGMAPNIEKKKEAKIRQNVTSYTLINYFFSQSSIKLEKKKKKSTNHSKLNFFFLNFFFFPQKIAKKSFKIVSQLSKYLFIRRFPKVELHGLNLLSIYLT